MPSLELHTYTKHASNECHLFFLRNWFLSKVLTPEQALLPPTAILRLDLHKFQSLGPALCPFFQDLPSLLEHCVLSCLIPSPASLPTSPQRGSWEEGNLARRSPTFLPQREQGFSLSSCQHS